MLPGWVGVLLLRRCPARFLDGNGVVMLGKIVKKTDKVEAAKGKK